MYLLSFSCQYLTELQEYAVLYDPAIQSSNSLLLTNVNRILIDTLAERGLLDPPDLVKITAVMATLL